MSSPEEILAALKTVKYPGLGRDIVSFGFVRDIEVGSLSVRVVLAPTTTDPQVLTELQRRVRERLEELPDLPPVEVEIVRPEPARRRGAARSGAIPGVQTIVAVASGKGGVGKSMVAVHLAFALASLGKRVGLLDADVYGPSIPQMLALRESPRTNAQRRIVPLERSGVRVMSMGLLIDRGQPVIWRGPMIAKVLTQFFRDVDWGELDVLVLDLPPGTGDAQLTISQELLLSGGVIVTTPHPLALEDVRRGVAMFRQVRAPVLGVVENMSAFVCSHCGKQSEPFARGGGKQLAEQLGLPFLGSLPLAPALMRAGEVGQPLVLSEPSHPVSRAFFALAERLWDELASRPPVLPVVE